MARSSIGSGYWSFKPERWVQLPYELLTEERKTTGCGVTASPRALGARACRFESDHPDSLTDLLSGSVTAAWRSDMSSAVVQLHPGLLRKRPQEDSMFSKTKPTKRIRPTKLWGRGVTVALRTFNPASVGSNPSGPTRRNGDRQVALAGA